MVQEVNSGVTVETLTGNNLGPFATDWPFETFDEFAAFLETNGLESRLTQGVDFYVSGVNSLVGGGNVLLDGALLPIAGWGTGVGATVYRLVMRRETALNQGRPLSNSDRIKTAAYEAGLDKLSRAQQDLRSVHIRTVTVPEGENGSNLPSLAQRAGKIGGWDEDGNFLADRTWGSFDDDVASTLANRAASDNNRELSEAAFQNSNLLFNNFGIAADLVEDRTNAARDQAEAAKEQAQTAYQQTQDFYEDNVANLGDRIGALENPVVISLVASTTVAETGALVAVTLTATYNQAVVTAVIDQGVGGISTATGAHAGIAAGNIAANRTWTLTVSNGFKLTTAQASIAFRLKRYWGVSAKAPGTALTNAEVLALASNEFATGYAKSGMVFDCTGGRYPVICWPATFGVPTEITVGGFASNDFTIETQDVTNASGHVDSYKILRLNTIQNGNAIGVTL